MVSYIYKKYMQWINQVQVFRTELADIESEIRKNSPYLMKDEDKATLILAAVAKMNKECSITDKIILRSLNKDRIVWTGKYNDYNLSDNNLIEQSPSLYGRIEKLFIEIANLQETVTHFLSTENIIENDAHNNKKWKKNSRCTNGIQRSVSLSKAGIL